MAENRTTQNANNATLNKYKMEGIHKPCIVKMRTPANYSERERIHEQYTMQMVHLSTVPDCVD
jgi:hypothetical protein